MHTLPQEIMTILTPFMQVFSRRVWDWAQILVVGAILAPGKRTVTSVLQVMGLKDEKQYQNYHRVLNRARWSSFAVSKILLGMLVTMFIGHEEPVILGADETMERRWGPKIKARSIFRDAKRSSRYYPNFSPGLRWLSMMMLVPLPLIKRVWALPFLTILAPSRKTNEANGKRHKTSVDWLGQMVAVVRRWLPGRRIVLVTDGGLTGVKLGWRCVHSGVTLVTRMNWRGLLYAPAGPRPKGKRGPDAGKGERLPSLKAVLVSAETVWQRCQVAWYGEGNQEVEMATGTALWYTPGRTPLPIRWVLVRDPLGEQKPAVFMATDQTLCPVQIVEWYIMRWSVEVTFQESRVHLGLETQRQWSDLAIARTTPALLGLFSLVTLLAHRLTEKKSLPIRSAAWYLKPEPTFADAIALVRKYLWSNMKYVNCPVEMEIVVFPQSLLHGLVDTVCYAT
jgi:hypothetical protein